MISNHDFQPQGIAVNHCSELLRPSFAADQREALLDEFAQGLCRDLAGRLAPLLAGVLPSVEAQAPEKLTAKALLRAAGEPQAHFLIDDGTPALRMIASIRVAQALSLTEFMFGGSGESAASVARSAQLPHSAVLVLEQVVAQFAEATRALVEGAASPAAASGHSIGMVAHPLRNPPLPPGDCCLAWPITIAIDEGTQWTVRLAGLERPLIELLEQGHARGERTPDPASAVVNLGQIPLRLAATVAQFDLPLSRLARLAVGDVFPIATVREIPLQIDGQVVAHGQLGAIDERCALRLSRLN